jgi:hypothetical protein
MAQIAQRRLDEAPNVALAGSRRPNAAACDAIYGHSQGIPRLINLLCDTALVYGFAEQKKQIDARTVDDVARDNRKGGIFPSQKKEARASTGSDEPAAEVIHHPKSPLDQEYYAAPSIWPIEESMPKRWAGF